MASSSIFRIVAFAPLLVVALAAPSCGSSHAVLAAGCSINSDCDSPLVCAFGRCHAACKVSSDCPATNPAEHCVVSGSTGVCELPQEVGCSATQPCPNFLLCALDGQCRSPCETNNQCPTAQICVAQPAVSFVAGACYETDGGAVADAAGPDGAGVYTPDGSGTGPSDGAATMADDGSAATTVVGPGCAGASTFGPQAVGASKTSHTSGVGTRTANGLLLFTSDSLERGDDAGMYYAADVQAFDFSGAMRDAGVMPSVSYGLAVGTLLAATTAPDGTTAILYDALSSGQYTSTHFDLLAPDLSIRVSNTIEASAADIGDLQWAGDRLALAWIYPSNQGPGIKLQMFGTDGSAFAGATLMTDVPSGTVGAGSTVSLAASAAMGLVAVGYVSRADGSPMVQILDLMANPVGGPIALANMQASELAIGGTASGFVAVYDGKGDAGEVQQAVAITPADGGQASVSAPTTLSGGTITNIKGSSDGQGAGFLVEYADGVSFAYSTGGAPPAVHVTPVAQAGGSDPINIASFGGRFGLFVYSGSAQAEYGVATGCPTAAGADH